MAHLGILTIEGVDAATFLQGYVTSDLDEVQNEYGAATALTDIKGRVLANGWHYGTKEKISLVLHASLLDPIAEHLGRYMVFSKSSISQDSNDMDVAEECSSQSIVLNPMGWHLVRQVSTEPNWPGLTFKERFPLVTDQTSGSFLPQMLSLTEHGAVSFTKGCYLGQEIVARAQHRGAVKRHLVQYAVVGGTVDVGEKVLSGKRNAGVVVASYKDKVLAVTSGDLDLLQSETGSELTTFEDSNSAQRVRR